MNFSNCYMLSTLWEVQLTSSQRVRELRDQRLFCLTCICFIFFSSIIFYVEVGFMDSGRYACTLLKHSFSRLFYDGNKQHWSGYCVSQAKHFLLKPTWSSSLKSVGAGALHSGIVTYLHVCFKISSRPQHSCIGWNNEANQTRWIMIMILDHQRNYEQHGRTN